MKYRWPKVLGILAIAPVLLGAGWLITTHSGDDVLLYDDHAKSLEVHVSPGSGGLSGARGLTFGPDGDLFVCSAGKFNWAILRYRHTGQFKKSFASGGGLVHPYQGISDPTVNFTFLVKTTMGSFGLTAKQGRPREFLSSRVQVASNRFAVLPFTQMAIYLPRDATTMPSCDTTEKQGNSKDFSFPQSKANSTGPSSCTTGLMATSTSGPRGTTAFCVSMVEPDGSWIPLSNTKQEA